jgi:hypothetical protein
MKKEMKKKKNLKWKDLEDLMGNIIVNSISSQYVVYIVRYQPHMSQCPQTEGMRVAIFKSINIFSPTRKALQAWAIKLLLGSTTHH